MRNLIVILMGGLSKERNISLLTGKACSEVLKKRGYEVLELDAKGYFAEKLNKLKPKLVFNALHGKYGEDGFVQSILESLKIPYTHSGVLSSSLAMDKELSKLLYKKNRIKTPNYFIAKTDDKINYYKKLKNKKISFPVVIKPINEGSSLGVYICKNKVQFKKNYNKIKKDYEKIIIEEYIPGKEIQVAVMGAKALGAIELVPKRNFYDYKAKYSSKAKTEHIMPARLTPINYKKALSLAKKAHKILGCRGATRSDFKFYNKQFYLLETNTQPGMTKLSLVPEIANYCKINFEELVIWMVNDASNNR